MSVWKNNRKCSICRIGWVNSFDTKTTIKDPNIVKKIEKCINAKIDEAKIPFLIVCERCQLNVNSAYDFWEKYEKSTILQQLHPVRPPDCDFELRIENEQSFDNNADEVVKCYEDTSTQTELLQSTFIIVNHLPDDVKKSQLEDIFSPYGKIQSIYFNFKRSCHFIAETFVRITFANEDETLRAWNAAQRQDIKHNNNPLAITLMSGNEAPINKLSDHCLSLIFLYIGDKEEKLDLEKVCKRWKQVSRHCWENFTELSDCSEGYANYDSNGRLQTLLRRCGKFLKSLTLHAYDNPRPRLQLVTQYCDHLETIQLWFNEYCRPRSSVYHQYVGQILQHSTKLRRVFIAEIDNEFDFNHFEHLSEDTLEIHLYGQTNDRGTPILHMNLTKFRNLKSLALCNFQLNVNSLFGFGDVENLEYLCFKGSKVHAANLSKIRHFTKLKHLSIANCQIDDSLLSKIVQNNLDLIYLDVSYIKSITNAVFEHIRRLPKLRELHMANVNQVSSNVLCEISSLEVLNCNRCLKLKDWPLMMMVDSCLRLRELHAVGVATWRFLLSSEETLKQRQRKPSNDDLTVYVDHHLQEKWQNFEQDVNKDIPYSVWCANRVMRVEREEYEDSEADPSRWFGWYTERTEYMASENVVPTTTMECD